MNMSMNRNKKIKLKIKMNMYTNMCMYGILYVYMYNCTWTDMEINPFF